MECDGGESKSWQSGNHRAEQEQAQEPTKMALRQGRTER